MSVLDGHLGSVPGGGGGLAIAGPNTARRAVATPEDGSKGILYKTCFLRNEPTEKMLMFLDMKWLGRI